ncbi:MAG: hypothetical protein P8X90_20095, partial [Desulfobacterales bacterium]
TIDRGLDVLHDLIQHGHKITAWTRAFVSKPINQLGKKRVHSKLEAVVTSHIHSKSFNTINMSGSSSTARIFLPDKRRVFDMIRSPCSKTLIPVPPLQILP